MRPLAILTLSNALDAIGIERWSLNRRSANEWWIVAETIDDEDSLVIGTGTTADEAISTTSAWALAERRIQESPQRACTPTEES